MILEAKGLTKTYGGRKVVSGLSFSVSPAEVVGLLGPNGAGKTTAFYMAMGIITPDQGQVLFQDRDVTHLPIWQRARLGLGYLAQEPSIFGHLTVAENLLLILEQQKEEHRLDELLAELHLTPLADKRAGSLSGGERRRLEITRALINQPSCLLLDEPFANIDPLSIHEVQELIRHLKAKGISVLITDHNAREILRLADRCYLICDGQLILSGTSDELLASPTARTHYLGENFTL